jgi:hypothetical protein
LNIDADSIHFLTEFQNGSGCLLGVEIPPNREDITSITKETTLDINSFHTMLGHLDTNVVSATSKKFGIKHKVSNIYARSAHLLSPRRNVFPALAIVSPPKREREYV